MEFDNMYLTADKLHAQKKYQKNIDALAFLASENHEISQDVEWVWRTCRGLYEVAKDNASEQVCEKYLADAMKLSRDSLDKFPTNAQIHKWYAIILSGLGDSQGKKERLESSWEIREHAEMAIRYHPDGGDGTIYHLLGRWCYEVTSVGWLQRKMASTLFGKVPESSIEDALGFFLEAEKFELRPKNLNVYYIAMMCEKLGRWSEAYQWYSKLTLMPRLDNEDEELFAQAVASMHQIGSDW